MSLPQPVKDAVYWLIQAGREDVAQNLTDFYEHLRTTQTAAVERLNLANKDALIAEADANDLRIKSENNRSQLESIARELGLPVESLDIAGCDVLAHYVRDLRINYERAHNAQKMLSDLVYLCRAQGMDVTMFQCGGSSE